MAVLCTKRARSLNMFLVKSKINMSVCIWHAGMASANGNSDAATSTAEARSYDYLNEFYEQISTEKHLTFVYKLFPPVLKNNWAHMQQI